MPSELTILDLPKERIAELFEQELEEAGDWIKAAYLAVPWVDLGPDAREAGENLYGWLCDHGHDVELREGIGD